VRLADAKYVTGMEFLGFYAVAVDKSATLAGAIVNQDLIVVCTNTAVKRRDAEVIKADCGGPTTAHG
jgi:hypothetical protein